MCKKNSPSHTKIQKKLWDVKNQRIKERKNTFSLSQPTIFPKETLLQKQYTGSFGSIGISKSTSTGWCTIGALKKISQNEKEW